MLIIRISRKSISGAVTDGVSRRVPIPDGVYPDVAQVLTDQGLANWAVVIIQGVFIVALHIFAGFEAIIKGDIEDFPDTRPRSGAFKRGDDFGHLW